MNFWYTDFSVWLWPVYLRYDQPYRTCGRRSIPSAHIKGDIREMVPLSPSFVNFDSKWFRSYSRVVLETNPNLARMYLADALDAINEQLTKAPEEAEREAMLAALCCLHVLQRDTQLNKKTT